MTQCTVNRLQSGIWPFAMDRVDRIGNCAASVWAVDNIKFIWHQRSEHLVARQEQEAISQSIVQLQDSLNLHQSWTVSNPEDDIALEDALSENNLDNELLAILNDDGPDSDSIGSEGESDIAKKIMQQLSRYVPSLPLPLYNQWQLSSQEYLDPLKKESYLHLGRQIVQEETERVFRGTLWMINDITELLEVKDEYSIDTCQRIEHLARSFHFGHMEPIMVLIGIMSHRHILTPLRDFFNVMMPPGFPLQIEIPLATSAFSVVVHFSNLCLSIDDRDTSFYATPTKAEGYREGYVLSNASTIEQNYPFSKQ